ncbi:39S ribosomal protein L28, mitochondrial [Microtus ochrogaster]|uniref:39S ribosomal protein L28, mitochondrial n=1 Tax=Microtus ochrogaster TaxID=79684 RepID=A0A8J6GWR1_MICOH|nr:39S ribosomal protein L28, mitochondrial [Microtus ochrogaster]
MLEDASAQLSEVEDHAMPLHKYPVYLWQKLRLRQGIYARLPAHFLGSLEEQTPTTTDLTESSSRSTRRMGCAN